MSQLGHFPLTKLSPQQVQSSPNVLLERVSPQTVHHAYMVLKTAFRHAVRIRSLVRSPMEALEPPRVSRYRPRVLSQEETLRFIEAARSHRLFALLLTALATGARAGELFARKWEDIDADRGVMRITTTLVRRKGTWQLDEPKSVRSRRSVMLPPLALTALAEHRNRQQLERQKAGEDWQDLGFVFATRLGTPLLNTDVRVRALLPVLKKAGLPPIRFHDLRHTAATLLLAAGEHPKVMQELLGHSTVSTTLDIYSHVTESMQRTAAQRMQTLLGGQIGGQTVV